MTLLKPLREDHEAALDLIDRLEVALIGFQFEGKAHLGRHVKQVRTIINFFLKRFATHTKIEEQIIFPYLASHIPKLNSVLPLLCSEHQELKKSMEELELLIELFSDNASKINQVKTIQKIRELGTYLAYLLKHHIEVEHANIYQMIDSELRHNEKQELKKKLNKRAVSLAAR